MKKCAIVVFFLLFACSTGFKIYRSNDQFNPDIEKYLTSKIELRITSLTFSISYATFEYVRNANLFYVLIDYEANNWLFIEKLIFLVNSNRIEIIPCSEPIRDVFGTRIAERVKFKINDDFINEIIKAQDSDIYVRIEGDQYYTDRIIKNKDVKNIILFFNQMHLLSKNNKT